MDILCFAGSLRIGSYNKKMVRIAHKILGTVGGVQSTLIDLADFPLPVYNQDIESREFPPAALQIAEKVEKAQGIVIATPENNGSIAAVLKNTVDWVSRTPHNPWPGKWILLLGASPGALGAVRGLWHTRVPFEALGCFVYPEMMGLPRAHEAFDFKDEFKDLGTHARLAKLLSSFVASVQR